MRRYSLVLRVVGCLFIAQILAFTIAWLVTVGLGLSGVDIFATSLDELSAIRAKEQVISSLTMNQDLTLEIRPKPDLLQDLARAPGMRFAAFKGLSHDPVAGSSPELVAMLRPLIEISPTHVHFVLPGDPSAIRAGLMEPLWTPFGRLHIAVYGQKFRWSDIFYVAMEELRWLIAYLIMAIIMSAGAAWFAVRWGLRPLSRVAEQASRIDMNCLHQRLDANDVSSEMGPLVDAVNDALARLDAGVARQKRFTANAAHELRTPVNVLGVRLDAPEEPTFKNDLKRDHRRIRNIVEQLLASARLGEQTTRLDEAIDLVALTRTMIADAALLALKARCQFVLDAPGAPVLIEGNRPALESVIANVIDNALRAEPQGGTVHVRVAEDATLAVIDHGCGIDQTDRDLIFEPFWRKNDAVPGTGLGLAIAKELIDAHRGRIWVEDTPGGGATFKLWFPAATSETHANLNYEQSSSRTNALS
ncbi:MAG: HAMP domain-containing sensor histidine kinase [Methylocystis sp.]